MSNDTSTPGTTNISEPLVSSDTSTAAGHPRLTYSTFPEQQQSSSAASSKKGQQVPVVGATMAGGCCRRPRLRDFGFRTDNAGDFTRVFCECCNNNTGGRALWALYRLILPILYIGYIVWYWAFFNGVGGKGFTFLTNWTVWGFTLYLIMAAVNLIWDRLCRSCTGEGSMYEADEPDVGVRHALQWLLFTIFCNGEIIVAVVYWNLLHDGGDTEEWIHDIFCHLAPAIISVFDILFSATPVRLMHFIYTIFYGVTYFMFAVFYWLAGGKGSGRDDSGEFTSYIYSFMNFEDEPAMAVGFLVIMVIVTSLIHVGIWGIYRFKRYLGRCGDDGRSEEAANAEFTMVKT